MRASDNAEAAAFRAHALEIVGNWSVHDDDDGHLFYYNVESGESRWLAPEDELRALESACMMKLMVDGALARSGAWTVHDTGDGAMYYFNEKTHESVWERPAQWGVDANVVAGNGQATVPPPPPPPSGPPGQAKKAESAAGKTKEPKPKKKKHKKERVAGEIDHTEKAPLSAEDLETLRKQAEEAQRSRESFQDMLRDKKIMPFCKWSVAFPQIVGDPRFLAIPTMEKRQEIFEEFVKQRPSDLKSEKKQKLKEAKKKFLKFLRQQFQQQRERGAFDEKLKLSVFLATLENDMASEDQYQTLQHDVLAFLPLAVQEKLWQKEMTDFLEATKGDREQEAQLKAFLLDKLAARGPYVSWHDGVVQDAVKTFTGTHTSTKLSESIQQAVVGQVAKALSLRAAADATRYGPLSGPRQEMRTAHRDDSTSQYSIAPRADSSVRNVVDHHDRGRRDGDRGHRSHSRDRDRERGRRETRERGPRGGGHSSSRSRSSSRSKSRSRSRGRRRDRERDRGSDSRRPSHRERSRRSRSQLRSRSVSRSSSRERRR